jgi:hypothetical protein
VEDESIDLERSALVFGFQPPEHTFKPRILRAIDNNALLD